MNIECNDSQKMLHKLSSDSQRYINGSQSVMRTRINYSLLTQTFIQSQLHTDICTQIPVHAQMHITRWIQTAVDSQLNTDTSTQILVQSQTPTSARKQQTRMHRHNELGKNIANSESREVQKVHIVFN